MTTTPLRIQTNEQMSPFVSLLLMREQFFGHIFRHVNFTVDNEMSTAGVCVKDSDLHLFWSPKFVSSLPDNHVIGLLKHEAFHLIFHHCTKRRLEPHNVFNLAADLAINCGIPPEELPTGGYVPSQKHINFDGTPDTSATAKLVAKLPRDMSAEWYFTKLMEDEEAKKEMTQGGNGFDDHGQWGEMTAEEAELASGKVREILKGAVAKADSTATGWGSIPSEMRKHIREMVSNDVDWRAILRQFVRQSRRGASTTTWSNLHMSSLHEDYGPANPGRKHGVRSNINVYVDQSGSVSDDDLALLFAELRNFAGRTAFTCYAFDTEVDEKTKTLYKGRGIPQTHGTRYRTGGTCFEAPTKHANKQKNIDGYIILTDGGAAKPSKSKVKRCYVVLPNTKLAFTPDAEDHVVEMKAAAKE